MKINKELLEKYIEAKSNKTIPPHMNRPLIEARLDIDNQSVITLINTSIELGKTDVDTVAKVLTTLGIEVVETKAIKKDTIESLVGNYTNFYYNDADSEIYDEVVHCTCLQLGVSETFIKNLLYGARLLNRLNPETLTRVLEAYGIEVVG